MNYLLVTRKNRWRKVALAAGAALVVAACGGGDDDGDPNRPPSGGECVPNDTDWTQCIDGAIFLCPAEGGAAGTESGFVKMEFVRDCEAEGLSCDVVDDDCEYPDGHIIGESGATYEEMDLASSNVEDTGYTLDLSGLSISGTFAVEDGDTFEFQTGEFSKVTIQAFVNGVAQKTGSSEVTLLLDAADDDGLSTLMGSGGYFIRAAVTPNSAFRVTITGGPTSGDFLLEIVGVLG